jgi:hypothetical protein
VSDKPIEISMAIVGGVQVETRFLTAGTRVREQVLREMHALTIKLQRKVKEEKLSGQVLKVRTGKLHRSINQRVTAAGDSFLGRVGTNVEYGRAWELGFDVPARDIYPKNAQALFWPGARHPVAHVHQPARHQAGKPFLRPALDEMRPEIQFRLARAAWLGI